MSDTENRLKDPVERTALLTAYVAGRCTPDESRDVETVASREPQVAEEIEFLKLLRQHIRSQSEEGPGDLGLYRLKREVKPRNDDSWRWIKVAAVAAVIVAVIQVSPWIRQEESDYRTLGNTPANEHLIQLKFQPEAKQSDIEQLLHELDAEIIAGPSAQGLYRLQLKSPNVGAIELDKAIAILQSRHDIVTYAGEEP